MALNTSTLANKFRAQYLEQQYTCTLLKSCFDILCSNWHKPKFRWLKPVQIKTIKPNLLENNLRLKVKVHKKNPVKYECR